jgi:lipid-A-disaccharide synthase
LLDGYREFSRQYPSTPAVILYPSVAIRTQLEAASLPPGVLLKEAGAEPVGASAVLTSSGTMSMHCALAGIPGAITYRTDPLTYIVGKWLVRVPYLGIANILLGEAMYPEFIQATASPQALAAQLAACVGDPSRRAQTATQSAQLRSMLVNPAGVTEADWLLRSLS